jgi:hypothetical protein
MIEYLPLVLTGIGIIASILYYSNVLRNATKTQQMQLETRQAQLFMSLYAKATSREMTEIGDHVMFRIDTSNYEELIERIHPDSVSEERTMWFNVLYFYDGMGLLLKRNLIDISMVDEMFGNFIIMMWHKMGPIELETRQRINHPSLFSNFEYLYNEIMRVRGHDVPSPDEFPEFARARTQDFLEMMRG